MKKKKITVIDYGVGNLFSVARALEYCGAEVVLAETPQQLAAADRLILPGVGAFPDGMHELESRKLVEPIRAFVKTGKPFFGICLGMQMLFDDADEFGLHAGLKLIPGRVEAIPKTQANGSPHKIPHIGWNNLRMPQARQTWDRTILAGTTGETFVYFVHSYTAVPINEADRLADCDYNGRRISAAVQRNNVLGCQFHPEKSGNTGLRILGAFLEL